MNHVTNRVPAEELIRQIQQMMDEVEARVSASEEASDREISRSLDALEARLALAKEKIQGFYHAARERITAGAQATDETIRGHPYESAAIALGVGVLVGACLRRPGRNGS